ncbi:MAG: sigma-54-dependent Fis family transcriptional regulator [Deltaproteobacteria bacterium]|nr:sigma-54-dependent Fis family transcriptional regulator [Deltaproteobacteria bacterium]MBW2395065.1 sigma-54-dependent Fis family transcriptional regulator [Deltaproteobacteria bacterium]
MQASSATTPTGLNRAAGSSRDGLKTARSIPTLRPLPPGRGLALGKPHVLVVDDHELYRRAVERVLTRGGYEVSSAKDATEAMAAVTAGPLDLVMCDVKMPGISGLELVRQIHDVHPELPCIVVTGYGGAEASVEALRAGAFWYLEKAMDGPQQDVLRRLVGQAIEHGRLKSENRRLQHQLHDRYQLDNIVGARGGLHAVLEVVRRVAETDSTVLITGESGTGKEVIARALHYNSPRADRPLVTVNCGAIPEELLESELFGHVRGAFTNAVAHREGRFSAANGGTIFLDEIGDMSPNLQVKLLRVLQEKTFEPVGSSQTEHVDLRVIAATNQDLAEAIETKQFREDLFYRLNVIPIQVPPLRERREDIPLLVHHFLTRNAPNLDEPPCQLSEAALDCLVAQPWPGNVRQLENTIERMVVMRGEGQIDLENLPDEFRIGGATGAASTAPKLSEAGLSFNQVVDDFEADLIRQALERTHWNKNQAAQLLGLNRTTLIEKIKKKGLTPEV